MCIVVQGTGRSLRIQNGRVEDTREVGGPLSRGIQHLTFDGDLLHGLEGKGFTADICPIDAGDLHLIFRVGQLHCRITNQNKVQFIAVASQLVFRDLHHFAQGEPAALIFFKEMFEQLLVDFEVFVRIDGTCCGVERHTPTAFMQQHIFASRRVQIVKAGEVAGSGNPKGQTTVLRLQNVGLRQHLLITPGLRVAMTRVIDEQQTLFE